MRKIVLVLCMVLVPATFADAETFMNPTPIDWAGETFGPAVPYPSEIEVSGLANAIESVTVTLYDVSHTYPCDLDILLVGPTGANVLLMSDAGFSYDIVDVDITIADGFPEVPTPIVEGTYCPTDFTGYLPDDFPAPAPAGPWGEELAVFSGLGGNGTWSLYAVDDASYDTGAIAGGWSISITQVPEPTMLSLLGLGGLALVRRRKAV
ncbi:MAG: PEP-CTERM sorting domain-containing protein [Phycisphaerae bacterium]|nr:PEP-CTERM sorting domain-containing protein [Phycisphaerae bacterium]